MFHENWFSDQSCKVLASLGESVASLEQGRVVEIGCWEGRSTIALANAVWPRNVHAVDTWAGSPGEISEYLAGRRDVYQDFLRNISDCTRGNVVPHRTDWRSYFKTFIGSIKLIHIDATHTYDEVAANIETVLPRMAPGGVICGDDVHHEPVRRAVLDTLGDQVMVEASLWYWRAP